MFSEFPEFDEYLNRVGDKILKIVFFSLSALLLIFWAVTSVFYFGIQLFYIFLLPIAIALLLPISTVITVPIFCIVYFFDKNGRRKIKEMERQRLTP